MQQSGELDVNIPIYFDGKFATSADGTIAGSTMLLDEVVERLKSLGLFRDEYVNNVWRYHGMEPPIS